ncbi:MAG TPA: alpha-ketoglutarate-dependent dioxygenase AlkB [Motiliproteus sp.]
MDLKALRPLALPASDGHAPQHDEGLLWWSPEFIPAAECGALLHCLQQEIPWREDQITLFGRPVAIPRLQAWLGDPGSHYRYSGLSLEPTSWTPTCLVLKQRIEAALDTTFNSVLINLYRDGNDSVGWHADAEPELGQNPVIASLSLGAERRFCVRHRRDKRRQLELRLPSGSLLLMAGALQHHWLHALPKTRQTLGPRINLSYRQIVTL